MPRPRWIIEGYEPSGKPQWALPPNPQGDPSQCVGLRDWLRRKDIWDERKMSQIPGCGVDTTHMIRSNFRGNLGCSPMKHDCEDCKHYLPSKCKHAFTTKLPCPLDTQTYNHTTDDCLKCEHYYPSGYICMEWLRKGASWKDLWGSEKGKIALVCAPGPHLAEHKEEIAELLQDRDKYFAIGVSRAINVVPLTHYFTLERRKPAYWNPEKMKYPNVKLIASTGADTRMCRAFRHRYYGETFNGVSELGHFMDSGKERVTIALGNASADQLMAAFKLGAKEMWLYGYESACTLNPPDDKSDVEYVSNYYCDMAINDPHLAFYGLTQGKYFPVKGVDGKKCATSYDLMAVGAFCEGLCELIQSHGVPCVNKTNKGMFWLNREDPETEELRAKIKELEAK